MKLRKTLKIGFSILLLMLIGRVGYAQSNDKDTYKEKYMMNRKVLSDKEKYPWFTSGYENYTPDKTIVNALGEQKKHLSFTVIGGTWCSDTQNLLPEFMKVADMAGFKNNQVKIIGVDENKNGPDGTRPEKVQNVPTFIIYYDGKEIGRIVESVQQSIEADIYSQVETYMEYLGTAGYGTQKK